MKVAILAGGAGTRLAEETQVKPKPMVEIGGRPMLWHIMMLYGARGFTEFVIALGYRGEVIKKYMVEFGSLNGNLTVDSSSGSVRVSGGQGPDWVVELIETGTSTPTGGRIKQLAPYLGGGTFMLTYGDGVSDVDIQALLAFHRSHGKLATLTAVRPPARYGRLELHHDQVVECSERPQALEGWINGAFFVLEPQVLGYIEDDDVMWEHTPLARLAADGQLMAYRHHSFWQCMDTLREKIILERLWQSGHPPWKTWE